MSTKSEFSIKQLLKRDASHSNIPHQEDGRVQKQASKEQDIDDNNMLDILRLPRPQQQMLLLQQRWLCALCTKENTGNDLCCQVCGRAKGHMPRSGGLLPFHPQCRSWDAASKGLEYVRFKALLAVGADPNTQDADGWTGLHWAAAFGRDDLIELLLENGAIIDAKRNDGWTALHIVSQGGFEDCLELLLSHGADIHAVTQAEGMNAVHIAALEGNDEVVHVLVLHDARVNTRVHKSGWTPLHLAAMRGNVDVVRELLTVQDNNELVDDGGVMNETVADPTITDFDGWTPGDIAALRGHKLLAELLRGTRDGADNDATDDCAEYARRHDVTKNGKQRSNARF